MGPLHTSTAQTLRLLPLVAGLALLSLTYGCGGDNGNVTNVPPTPRGTPTPESEVDREIRRLSRGVAGFEAPTTMEVGEVRSVVVHLSPDENSEEAVRANLRQEVNRQAAQAPGSNIESRTHVETERVEFSRVMEAKLVGQGFDIQPITSERQPVTGTGTTEWRWDVKARASGTQNLHLTMTAFLNINGREETRPVKVLSKVITVESVRVPWTTRVGAFFEKNPWVYTAVLIPLFVWLMKRRSEKKKEREQRRDEPGGKDDSAH